MNSVRRSKASDAGRRLILTVTAALAVGAAAQSARAQEPNFTGFPFVVYCEFEGIQKAYFFSQLGQDGRAIYLSPDRQLGAITLDGVAERIGGDRPGSCQGKTLEDLRAAGLAFDLPK